MLRRQIVRFATATIAGPYLSLDANAFIGPLLALLGRNSLRSIAGVAGSARAGTLERAATRTRFNFNPQFTLSVLGDGGGTLRPRIQVRSAGGGTRYRSPTIYIREVNLTLGQERDITIAPMEFPAGFEGHHDVSLGNLPYQVGCDYLREVVSVDECGCEARWQPEAIAVVSTQGIAQPPPAAIFPFGSSVSCPQVPIGNGWARCQ